jgi:hypothetical protein
MQVFRRSSIAKPTLWNKNRGLARRRRLSFESLESRRLLAATGPGFNIGVGISNISYYNDSFMWANVMEQANSQWLVGKTSPFGTGYGFVTPPSGVAMPAYDSNGYPIGLGGLAAQGYSLATYAFTNIGAPFPTGKYTLTFDGKGTILISNGNQPTQSFTQNGGSGAPSNVNIDFTEDGITVAIISSDPTDYVRNIRLVMPGLQNSYQANPFNPQFLNAMQPFSTIRFIGAMLPDFASATTSDGQSGPVTWADRTPPTYFTQATLPGMSVEYMVQLCNILHENMWVTMPVNGDSEYVTKFAQYVEQNLDPGLKVYVELGDELWNSNFVYQFDYVQSYATAHNESHEYATADLTSACWGLWSQAFAGQTDRMVRVVANFFGSSILSDELNRLIATSSPTDPDHGFDAVSVAPYFQPDTSSYNASTTVSQIESDLMTDLASGPWRQALDNTMATVATFEAQLGRSIPVDMYEGGEGLTCLASASWYNTYLAVQTDPGMYAVNTAFLDDLAEAGVQGIEYVGLAALPNQWGQWGAMEYVGQPSSQTPKYNAIANFTSLGITGPSSPLTAGTQAQFTVAEYESNGTTVDTGFTGLVRFSSSDPQAVLPAAYTFTAADQGEHTFTVTLKTAGEQSITATGPANGLVGTLAGIAVEAAPALSMVFTGLPSVVYAGLMETFEIKVGDAYGNAATGFTGTVQLACSDPSAGLPSSYTFTPADAGVHTFSVSLQKLGNQTITASTTVAPILSGRVITTVDPLVATRDTKSQGTWLGAYGSQGYNAVNNSPPKLPSYATVSVTGAGIYSWAATTSPRALQTPTGSARVAGGWLGSNGGTITMDVNLTDGQWHNLALYFLDWGNWGLNEKVQVASAATGAVLDTETVSSFYSGMWLVWSISGDVVITITGQAGSSPELSGVFLDPRPPSGPSDTGSPDILAVSSPSTTAAAGTPQAVTVTALSSSGGVDTNFTGTVHIASSDPKASLPGNYTFTSADAGVHAFMVNLETAGVQSVTVTDLVNALITGNELETTVKPAAASSLTVAGFPGIDTAGASGNFTVTAYDPFGNVATGYTGAIQFSSSDPKAALPGNCTFTAADAGVHTFTMSLETAGAESISATDTVNQSLSGIERQITVNPAGAASLAVAGFPAIDTAGAGANFTITAYDPYGNVATGYTGAIRFQSSDPKASLPAGYTFTAADAGIHTFTLSLQTAGAQAITASDTVNHTISGTESQIKVNPAAVSSLSVTGFPSTESAGAANSFTVTAYDQYGNIATGFVGAVQFASSDPKASLPAIYTFASADAGAHTFTATLATAGAQTITATDTANRSISGSESNITVSVGAAATLTVAGFPSPVLAGASASITVTAYAPGGNIATGYAGTIRLSSSDPKASLPASYTFTAADAGVHTFMMSLETAGSQSITATDTVNQSMSSAESQITVQPAPASSLTVTGFPNGGPVGAAGNFTVTAYDPYGNIATGYVGTVQIASSDPKASLPARYTFTPADAGVHTFTAKLETAGSQSISATDSANRSISGTESNISVGVGTADSLIVTGSPGPAVAGVSESFTVSAYDPGGNVAKGYTGTIQFSSSDPKASLPASYTFTGADAGVHAFTITFETAGPQSITATDSLSQSISGTGSQITVKPGAATSLTIAGFPTNDTAGAIANFTVTAYDEFGNVATGYAGTVQFKSSDQRASLPRSYEFSSSDSGVHTFAVKLIAAGSQSVSVTDLADQSISGSDQQVNVNPAAAYSLSLTGIPSIDTAGAAANLTVVAHDRYGNVATGYTGTIRFASSDHRATLPASFTFTSADAGMHKFTVKLKTAGTQSVTATDTVNKSMSGRQSYIWVRPAPPPPPVPPRHHHPMAVPIVRRPAAASKLQLQK